MNQNQLRLGVNIDHVATLRQARHTRYPSVIDAAKIALNAGATGITAHLREDRRHIQEEDIQALLGQCDWLNLEMAVTEEMVRLARLWKPAACCLVPERREELTTEGGLDVIRHFDRIRSVVSDLTDVGIEVSLFIDPDEQQVRAAAKAGAKVIELHTGAFSAALPGSECYRQELDKLISAAAIGDKLDMQINAGHGLHHQNVAAIARIPQIVELNIGHAIISHALFVGLEQSVAEMLTMMSAARA